MSTDVVKATRNRRAIDALRDQIAPDVTDEELLYLAQVGQRLGLDPIAGHIVLIQRYDGRLKRKVARPQITADGRLVLADRTGELDGFDGPEWCGARQDDGTHRWVDVWDDDEPPHAARVFVYRKGRTHPANGTVRWKEFSQTDGSGALLPTWRAMPSHMLGKVALSLGLRRAFPGIIPTDLEIDDVAEVTDPGPEDNTDAWQPGTVGLPQKADPETGEIPPTPPVVPPEDKPTKPGPDVSLWRDGLLERIKALSVEDKNSLGRFLAAKKIPPLDDSGSKLSPRMLRDVQDWLNAAESSPSL